MKSEFLRHTLSTISYRFKKSVENTENDFGNFSVGKGSRTPNEIINHMCFILRATRVYLIKKRWEREALKRMNLNLEMERFNSELQNIDNVIGEKDLESNYTKLLLQGPFLDILTHIGQISMLK